jgi:hypothetical protein
MVPLIDLIWPVLLATGAVFLVSWAMGILLPDSAKVVHGGEAVSAGIQELASQSGEYVLPAHAHVNHLTYHLTVAPGGTTASRLEGRAAFHLAMNIMIAYLAGLALLPDTGFNPVFRFAASVAFLGYGSTSLHGWLSERRPWRLVWRPACRALACSLVAGSIFAVLWPPT